MPVIISNPRCPGNSSSLTLYFWLCKFLFCLCHSLILPYFLKSLHSALCNLWSISSKLSRSFTSSWRSPLIFDHMRTCTLREPEDTVFYEVLSSVGCFSPTASDHAAYSSCPSPPMAASWLLPNPFTPGLPLHPAWILWSVIAIAPLHTIPLPFSCIIILTWQWDSLLKYCSSSSLPAPLQHNVSGENHFTILMVFKLVTVSLM